MTYGTATILLSHVDESCLLYTYDASVATLRGMVEWMTLYDEFYEWVIAVSVEGYVVGYATIKNREVPVGELMGEPVSLVGAVPSAVGETA